MTPEESNIVNHATIKYFVGNAWWSVLVAFLKQNQKTSFLMFSKPMMSDQLLEALSMHYNFYQFSCRIDSNIWKYHVVPYCDLPNLRDLLRKETKNRTSNIVVKLGIKTNNIVPYVTMIRTFLYPIHLKTMINTQYSIDLSIERSRCTIRIYSYDTSHPKNCLTYDKIQEINKIF